MLSVSEQLENGNWCWSVQLDDAPDYFEVGVSADEVTARRDARAALDRLRERQRAWPTLH